MIQSLLLKLGMLAMTMGVVFWIGWQAPEPSLTVVGSEAIPAAIEKPVAPSKPDLVQAQASRKAAKPVLGPAQAHAAAPPQKRGPLDLNRASAEELESLPGIGSVIAQRVIEYRKAAGGFQTVEDLRQVKGIGAKKFDRVRPLLRVSVPGAGKTEKQSP